MERFRNFIKRFFLIDDTPHKIAAGAALGIFMGIMPGEGFISALILATIFRFNRLATTAGVAITNMWVTFLVLPLAAIVGGFLFGISPNVLNENFQSTYKLGIKYFFTETILFQLVLPLIVGFFIVSVSIALIFYFLLYFLLKYKKIRFK